jgi:hypothetical protein
MSDFFLPVNSLSIVLSLQQGPHKALREALSETETDC